MSLSLAPTNPTVEQINFWKDRGWKYLGLGRFRNEHNQQGVFHVHKDGRTGIKINNYCVIVREST